MTNIHKILLNQKSIFSSELVLADKILKYILTNH